MASHARFRRTPLAFLCSCLLVLLSSACSEKPDTNSDTPQQREQTSPLNAPQPTTGNTQKPQDTTTTAANSGPLQLLDISERNLDGKNGIAVSFSSPIDASKDIQSYFSITTSDAKGTHNKTEQAQTDQHPIEGSWVVDKTGKRVWFMNVEPRNTYTIIVNPGVPADVQSALLSGATETLTTRSLQPSVNFDSDGMILPLGYVSGLPVVSVNINAVDVDFFRIDEDNISQFIDYAYRYGREGWYARNLKSYGELAYSARFELNPPANTRTKRDLDIQQIDELKKAGLYLAVMRPAGDYDQKQITWFTITDIGLHVRQYKNQLDVHASSLTTGEPLSGVTLSLVDSEGRELFSNATTPNGLASFNGNTQKARLLVAKQRNQTTLLNLQQPALDLSEFELGSRPQLPNELFIYGPRDLYRPGEMASFSALLRDHDGKLAQAPILSASLRNPSGSTVKSFKWRARELAYYQYDWNIPDNAPTGQWQLVVTGTMEKPVSFSFHVEEFLPERMKLSLGTAGKRTEILSAKETLSVPLLGEYLYGAPAAGNKFGSALQISHWRKPIETLNDYQFGNLNDARFTAYQELDDQLLDKQGKGLITASPSWSESRVPLQISVVGSLYESGGRPITRAHQVLVWPTETLIGIRPHFGDSNPKPSSNVKFDLVNAKLSGEFAAAKDVQASLIREDRQYFWEFNQGRGWHWNYSEKEFPVATKSLSLTAQQPYTLSFPVEWGRYRLEVRNESNDTLSSIRFFAGHDWYYDWKNARNAASARPDAISLALDKSAYSSGDVAQLKILPPASGEALILVESDKPLWSKKQKVQTEGSIVNIPINPEWDKHNIYISVLLLQASGKKILTTPKRAMGIIHLPLQRQDRKLDIDIKTADNALPMSTLKTQIQLQNPSTQNKQTLLTLAAVDVGVLNISNFETPNPFHYFFEKRRYNVDAKDIYADVIDVHQSTKAKQRFGGDADLVRGGNKPQSDVHIVSMFHGPVTFNEEGTAQIDLKLPDFNGRLRLMALAFNGDSFGSSDKELTIAAPIVAEISMPRFLAKGDNSLLSLDIQNMTDSDQRLNVDFNVSGPLQFFETAEKNAHTEIFLKTKQKTTLRFPVKAIGHSGMANIQAAISGDNIESFTRSWGLGVRPAYPAISENVQTLLLSGETYQLNTNTLPAVFSSVLTDTLQASVNASAVVNLDINSHLKNLLAYPYGCLEQTSSRAWPLTYATPENQQRFNLNPIAEQKRLDMIEKGIDRILSFQRSNGSFGLWGKDSPEEHWLTVYATDFLLNARQLGMDVPEKPLEKALKRLSYYINGSNSFVRQRWSTAPKHYAFATRAYAAYVLSKLKRAPLGTLRHLYATSFSEANSAYSQIHLALALMAMGDSKTGEEALQKAITHFPKEYQYWGDYGSEIRDLGMTIHLLLSHQKMQSQALELSLQLKDALRHKRWLSTQERIALFMAGIALETELNDSWQATWQEGQSPAILLESAQAWQKNLGSETLQEGVKFSSKHSKPLYLNTLLNGYGSKPPQAQSQGMELERNWYNIHGEAVNPSRVNSGDLLLVHISLHSEQRIPDALVIHLLPAGFELENQNLEHALKLEKFTIDGETIPELQKRTRLKHTEFRDDRFVAAVDHRGYRPSHIFFMVRAVTPGDYQVPPVIAEDMYRPEIRAISDTLEQLKVSAE